MAVLEQIVIHEADPDNTVRTRGHFPNDAAATKLIWWALRNVEEQWANAPISWHAARAQFAIKFQDRFTIIG